MKVIKKSGFRQPYDINKVKIALQKTAKSINGEFKEEDWKEFKPRVLARLEPIMEGREEIFFWEIDECVMDSLLRSRFKEIAKEYISSRSRTRQDKLNDLGLSQLSMWLLKERYLKKDSDGNPIETAREMMCRVATAIASVEKNQQLKEYYSEKFTNILCNLEFLPSSPCLVSAGTNKIGTYLSCYAFEIDDSLESIFNVLKDSARIFQMGGGVGISISKLREKGAPIKTSNGVSSGPISFLHLFNTMVDTVKAGGFRRGALLALMRYDHPDIEEFIQCKRKTDTLNNMNISVMVDDDFFKAVRDNKDIDLKSPNDRKVVRRIPAALLLEQIAHNVWETGEPGLLFYNRINKDNPTPHLGDLRVCNPCAEATLLNKEACDLGSINIVKHMKDGGVDWDKLAETTRLAIRFLDNMIDASPQPTKEIHDSIKRTRKVGLGIMGFADTLMLMDIKYSSKEAIKIADKIMSFINDVASKYSEELGKEKGLYEAYKEGYRRRRNAIITTQAPTGSLSIIAGVSSGIEPNLAKEYTRIIGSEVVKVSHPSMSSKSFETANEIPLEQHIAILSEFQKNVENAVSKTCNVPEQTTVQNIKDLIVKAWEMDVKGITIFRDKCAREGLIKPTCEECKI
jgi:ribonucleoside-diphosphate reductase alpha chain